MDRIDEAVSGVLSRLPECRADAAALRAGDGDAVLFLRPEDMKYQERVAKAFGHACEIRADSGIRIGGIRAVNNAAGLTADATLDASLEDQRVWFEENSGLAVV